MPTKVKVPYEGVMQDGEPVSMTTQDEKLSTYTLQDGTTLTIRPVVMSVVRVDGKFDNMGNPVYVVGTQLVMGVVAPGNLRRQG